MELKVSVQIAGRDVPCGILFQNVRRGTETVSFRYERSYLTDPKAFALSPDMPLTSGSFHSVGLGSLRAFEDCMPDRWGRNLMLRAERQQAREQNRTSRTLFETDMLALVSDETRQGAIRIWDTGGKPLASAQTGVPRATSIPALLDASDAMAEDLEADVRDLFAAGSSLGGARPKASVRDEHGTLLIAKFPKAEESKAEDVCAWERTALQLLSRMGVRVPHTRLLRVGGRSVLLTQRFDRDGNARTPYLSGLSAIQANDGESHPLLELVEFLEDEGSTPEADIRELWTRALFDCAVGNTDNHMRNQGLLRKAAGWRLSPAFDVNPSIGDGEKYLASPVSFDGNEADPRLALEACEYYRLTRVEAREIATRMADVLDGWRAVATANGISKSSIEAMASCFESGAERLRQAARLAR